MDIISQHIKAAPRIPLLAAFLAVGTLLLAAGCASPDVNPRSAKARVGYADFFCETNEPMSWDIAEAGAAGARPKELLSSFDPMEERIIRLSFSPGHHRLFVTFLNQVIIQKGAVEIEIKEGMITPVRVSLALAGTTLVERKEYSIGPTLHGGGGRTTKVGNYETKMWRVELKADEALPYQVKEQMPYYAAPAK